MFCFLVVFLPFDSLHIYIMTPEGLAYEQFKTRGEVPLNLMMATMQ